MCKREIEREMEYRGHATGVLKSKGAVWERSVGSACEREGSVVGAASRGGGNV